MDVVTFFTQQRASIAQLQREEIIALPDLQDDDVLYEDVQSINVPSNA